MTLKEAKKMLDTVNDVFNIGPDATLKEMASYRKRLLNSKQSASYTEAKRLVIEAEKKGA